MIAEVRSTESEALSLDNPFPGLRPFDYSDNDLFFGRDGQSEEMALRLGKSHFLAVVGTSGTGKSSLVRAGLLPLLFGDLMANAGSRWHVIVMRPGNNPIGKLASALRTPLDVRRQSPQPDGLPTEETRQIEEVLRTSSFGLVDAVDDLVKKTHFAENANVLVVVDQFEELFRFEEFAQDETLANDAAAFVKLLLKAKKSKEDHNETRIYVVLTMRSEFLGRCAEFLDLPESINDCQYLIPRMTYDQRRTAITGPVLLRGRKISPALVNRLMMDLGDKPEDLPLLQHALMRIWDKWLDDRDPNVPLDVRHYKQCGEKKTLNLHAEEAYEKLGDDPRPKWLAEKLFKSLTNSDRSNFETRRPTTLKELCAIADAEKAEMMDVIDVFRGQGRSFLTPSHKVELEDSTVIDISHESLINAWETLKEWVREESEAARDYRRLADDALASTREPLGRGKLHAALDWRERNKPNVAWASQYHDRYRPPESKELEQDFHRKIYYETEKYIDESKRARKRLKRLTRAGQLAVFAIVVAAIVFWVRIEAKHDRQIASIHYANKMQTAQRAFDEGRVSEANKILGELLIRSLDQPSRALFGSPQPAPAGEFYFLWRALHNESSTFTEHLDQVTGVASSPDGRLVASISRDGKVLLWEKNTRKIVGQSELGGVSCISFASDGKSFATGNYQGIVHVWTFDLSLPPAGALKPTQLYEFNKDADNNPVAVSALAFVKLQDRGAKTPDQLNKTQDQLLIGGAYERMTLCQVANRLCRSMFYDGKDSETFKTNRVSSVAFSPDGMFAVSAGTTRQVTRWEIRKLTGKKCETAPNQPRPPDQPLPQALSVAWSLDGATIAAGFEYGTIDLWNSDCHESRLLEGTNSRRNSAVLALAFTSNKSLVAANSDAVINEWSLDNRSPRWLTGHSDAILSLSMSSDGTIVTGSADKTIKLWKPNASPDPVINQELLGDYLSLSQGGTGLHLATRRDTNLSVWESLTSEPQKILPGPGSPKPETIGAFAYSRDGTRLAVIISGHYLVLRNSTGPLVPSGRYDTELKSLCFSPDGNSLAVGTQSGEVMLWNVSGGSFAKPRTLTVAPTNVVWTVAYSRNGWFAAGSADSTVRLWKTSELETGAQKIDLPGIVVKLDDVPGKVVSLAFSPDDKYLAIGNDSQTVRIQEVPNRKFFFLRYQSDPMMTLSVCDRANGVPSLAFSADGSRLATGCGDGSVRLWDTGYLNISITNKETLTGYEALATLRTMSSVAARTKPDQNKELKLTSMAFSADGHWLFAASSDGSIDVWQAARVETVLEQSGQDRNEASKLRLTN